MAAFVIVYLLILNIFDNGECRHILTSSLVEDEMLHTKLGSFPSDIQATIKETMESKQNVNDLKQLFPDLELPGTNSTGVDRINVIDTGEIKPNVSMTKADNGQQTDSHMSSAAKNVYTTTTLKFSSKSTTKGSRSSTEIATMSTNSAPQHPEIVAKPAVVSVNDSSVVTHTSGDTTALIASPTTASATIITDKNNLLQKSIRSFSDLYRLLSIQFSKKDSPSGRSKKAVDSETQTAISSTTTQSTSTSTTTNAPQKTENPTCAKLKRLNMPLPRQCEEQGISIWN